MWNWREVVQLWRVPDVTQWLKLTTLKGKNVCRAEGCLSIQKLCGAAVMYQGAQSFLKGRCLPGEEPTFTFLHVVSNVGWGDVKKLWPCAPWWKNACTMPFFWRLSLSWLQDTLLGGCNMITVTLSLPVARRLLCAVLTAPGRKALRGNSIQRALQ